MAKQTFTTGQVLTAAQMTSLQQTAMLGGSASAKTASYVLVAADAGTAITMSNASTTTITVNTGLFAAGDTVTIINIGAGTCTVTAGTATVSKPTNATLALVQNAGGVLYFTATGAATFMPFDVGSASSASTYSGVSCYNSGGPTISNSTYTALTFDTEDFDTDSYHSTSSNTSRITIPSGKAGKYLINAVIGWEANSTGTRGMAFYKNGALVTYPMQYPTASVETWYNGSMILNLAVSDYVEVYVFQSSGGNLNAKGTATGIRFQASLLGA
jgi:hypothetical protein